jgi:hypothetical protein
MHNFPHNLFALIVTWWSFIAWTAQGITPTLAFLFDLCSTRRNWLPKHSDEAHLSSIERAYWSSSIGSRKFRVDLICTCLLWSCPWCLVTWSQALCFLLISRITAGCFGRVCSGLAGSSTLPIRFRGRVRSGSCRRPSTFALIPWRRVPRNNLRFCFAFSRPIERNLRRLDASIGGWPKAEFGAGSDGD